MKQADADLGASEGERLPNVPRFTAAVDGDYTFSPGGLRPTIGASFRYVADRYASFNASTSYPQYYLPGYVTFDVRTGITVSSVDLQLYVHNLADQRGQLGVLLPQFGARVAIEQPRTVGLTASMRF
jgi:iron complex outermembrane recepter protein